MAVFALDFVLRLVGLRGHFPHHDGLGAAPSAAAADGGGLLRILAIAVAVFAVLSGAVWWSVRLAIELY